MGGAELGWMALVVEDDKSSNPVDVRRFRAEAVMLEPDVVADAREESKGLGRIHPR